MDYYSPVARATRAALYVLAVVVPLVVALAVVGTTPDLLEKVPAEHRDTVAAFGEGVARLNGADGGILASAGAGPVNSTIPGVPVPLPRHGEWSPRRPEDHPPPSGLVAGVDFALHTTEDGYVAHWPCEHEIPVRSYQAPPGSEADLAWSVETLAFASGLPLRYLGPGTEAEKEAEGAISVTYGDHPDFHGTDVAGVGGPSVWPRGLILHGSVTLRPDQISPYAGDTWSRSLTLHEIMHTLGIVHAQPYAPEVMAERPGPYPPEILGYGDQFALRVVGCR